MSRFSTVAVMLLAVVAGPVEAVAFPSCTNDAICDALDLGLLTPGLTLGDASMGNYNNECGSRGSDPNPSDKGAWYNDAGVWFRFRTGSNPSSLILIDINNDPEGSGDVIDIQAAVYRSTTNNCDGALIFQEAVSDNSSFDGQIALFCPRPNTNYYILVDGGTSVSGSVRGVFGLEVRDMEVTEGQDSRCRAEALGLVPDGGTVGTAGIRSNFCASSFGDPGVSAFATQVTVWFSFEAPASGHVVVQGTAAGDLYPLGIQLALFGSSNSRCTGNFTEVASSFTEESRDEQLKATCLEPGATYFVMVDGFGTLGRGMFRLDIEDGGDVTPVTEQDTTLCAGDTMRVGSSYYFSSGRFVDTLQVSGGCDSVVITNLEVLKPIQLEVEQTDTAVWNGAPGSAHASATGGTGVYTFEWCGGTAGPDHTRLTAGEECRLSVSDTKGCSTDTTFTVPFTTRIKTDLESRPALCAGASNAAFSILAGGGIPPYRYYWEAEEGPERGEGTLATDENPILVENLPAGRYRVRVADDYSDTTMMVQLEEPGPLEVVVADQSAVSCYGACDGAVAMAATGGNDGYRYSWNNGSRAERLSDLCAGNYRVTVQDANGCLDSTSVQITQPPEFTAIATEVKAVSCFDGSDGRARVTTNGQAAKITWNTGADSSLLTGVSAGRYTVTVTNEDGCAATGEAEVTQPAEPLRVRIVEKQPISCSGKADGVLAAEVAGPFQMLTYEWTDGVQPVAPEGLPAGIYRLRITNERGCLAEQSYILSEPGPITGEVEVSSITCLDPPNGGAVRILNLSGGRPEYSYSLDGAAWQRSGAFASLFAGEYELLVRDGGGCEKAFPVTVEGPPDLKVSLGEDRVIQLGDTLNLKAVASSIHLQYEWAPASLGMAASEEQIILRPLRTESYRVTVRDTITHCTATDKVVVAVRKERKVFAPNAFSPNGDGVNDFFTLYTGKGTVAVRHFRIFARNGALIYELKELFPGDTGWNGRFNGREMPPGFYVYTAEVEYLDGYSDIIKGGLVLVR